MPDMSFPTSACCVVVLSQQQQQNTYNYNYSSDDASVNYSKTTSKNCTVVENGQVVVRPSETPLSRAE